MIKILFVHHSTGWGGAPINLVNNINALDRSNYLPHVLLLKDSIVSEKLRENNIEFSIARSFFYKRIYNYFGHTEASYVRWYQFYKFFKLSINWFLSNKYFAKQELDLFEPDIIQLNSSVLTDWLRPASKKSRVIVHIQEPLRKGRRDFIHSFFRHQIEKYTDRIVAISHDNAKRIGLDYKTNVIYNTAEKPKNMPDINSYYSRKVLYLGGSAEIKGFFTLVSALNYLDKDIQVYFGGYLEGPVNKTYIYKGGLRSLLKYLLYSRYRKRLHALNKIYESSNVSILGMTNNVSQLLDEVCCLVSPFSISHFSRPVIEAQLHQKPVIVSNVEGMDEIVFHNINGLIVPVNNPVKLAESINYMCNNPELARKVGKTGYSFAIENFTERNLMNFMQVYSDLIR